jgi:hypothetical protein
MFRMDTVVEYRLETVRKVLRHEGSFLQSVAQDRISHIFRALLTRSSN